MEKAGEKATELIEKLAAQAGRTATEMWPEMTKAYLMRIVGEFAGAVFVFIVALGFFVIAINKDLLFKGNYRSDPTRWMFVAIVSGLCVVAGLIACSVTFPSLLSVMGSPSGSLANHLLRGK